MASIEHVRFRVQYHINATERDCRIYFAVMLLFRFGVPSLSFLIALLAGGVFGNHQKWTVGLAAVVTALTILHSAIDPAKRFAFAAHYNNLFTAMSISIDNELEAGKSSTELTPIMNKKVTALIAEFNSRLASNLSTIGSGNHKGSSGNHENEI